MRRPLLFLLLCLPVVLGAIPLGENQSSKTASLSAASLRLHPDAVEAKSAHAPVDSSLSSDTADVHCPVGPKHGDATIRIDSIEENGSVKVEPDSHLVAELQERWGRKWDYFGGRQVHVNNDEHPDLIVDVGMTILSKNVKTYTDIFVGCGNDRYVVVGERLLFDRFGTWDDEKEKWKTVYTKHNVEAEKEPPLTYTKRYHFYREQEEYRIVPESVWYTKRSAKRLGFKYESRPSCPAGGDHPPVKLKVNGEHISEGNTVERTPHEQDGLYVYWYGHINSDNKTDLILGTDNKDSTSSKYIYVKCSGKFYSEVYGRLNKGMKVLNIYDLVKEEKWKYIEVKKYEKDTLTFE